MRVGRGPVVSWIRSRRNSRASGEAISRSTGASALNQLSGNFSTFLTLLTTQLKNQDPTSPMDSNQFTQQLVQFAQVEQQLKGNDEELEAIRAQAPNAIPSNLMQKSEKQLWKR